MALGDEAFFFASDGLPGLSLWRSDGTEAGTLEVRAFSPEEVGDPPSGPTAEAAGKLFFLTRSGLWRTDGTEAGTFPLGVQLCCNFVDLRAVGGTVFFGAREGDFTASLWSTDGTVAGTRQIRHGEGGPFEPFDLTAFQGKLYFTAYDAEHGRQLWRSDGTEAGTVPVKEINPSFGSNPALLTVHAGRLWFFGDDDEHGLELWSSDGTAGGTGLAVDLEPGSSSFDATRLVSLGDRLLVFGHSPSQGAGLWVTDGTAAGTRKIADQDVSQPLFYPRGAVFQGRFYYGFGGLSVTDGTEAGTGPFLDRDGQPVPSPDRFAVRGDRLLFTVEDFGVSLWESDGTSAGTFRLLSETRTEFNPPGELVRAGSHVFFPAYSRETGVELWAVEEAAP